MVKLFTFFCIFSLNTIQRILIKSNPFVQKIRLVFLTLKWISKKGKAGAFQTFITFFVQVSQCFMIGFSRLGCNSRIKLLSDLENTIYQISTNIVFDVSAQLSDLLIEFNIFHIWEPFFYLFKSFFHFFFHFFLFLRL